MSQKIFHEYIIMSFDNCVKFLEEVIKKIMYKMENDV